MLLLLLVVVVAWCSQLRHDCAARVAAHAIAHHTCRWHRGRRSKADGTRLVNGWHHEVSRRCLLNFLLVIVELADCRLVTMNGVVLLSVVVGAVEGC